MAMGGLLHRLVYAKPEYGYGNGYTKTITDEKGQTDTYTITRYQSGYDISKAGQVDVTSYYDRSSGNTYTPVSNGTAVGTNLPGQRARLHHPVGH